MTPAARVAAAITILDDWLAGASLDRAATAWARSNRYAGSSDRAVIRDLVFQAARCRESYAYLGGSRTGRGLMIGHLRASGQEPGTVFSGERFAPAPLAPNERQLRAIEDAPLSVQLDWPEWALHELAVPTSQREETCRAMQQRAPIFLRANLLKGSRTEAALALAEEGIETRPSALSPTALEVVSNPRRVGQSGAYARGLVELQDAASQAVVDFAGVSDGDLVLDYCAGGGGKALALAAHSRARVDAHDVNAARMKEVPARATRAGADIRVLQGPPKASQKYDIVFCDAPCSGSGSWRRDPEGKWAVTADRLKELTEIQRQVLVEARQYLKEGGRLVYVTCSLFVSENQGVVQRFLEESPDMYLNADRQFTPADGADGFYVALLAMA